MRERERKKEWKREREKERKKDREGEIEKEIERDRLRKREREWVILCHLCVLGSVRKWSQWHVVFFVRFCFAYNHMGEEGQLVLLEQDSQNRELYLLSCKDYFLCFKNIDILLCYKWLAILGPNGVRNFCRFFAQLMAELCLRVSKNKIKSCLIIIV